jgi:hypothetical protein
LLSALQGLVVSIQEEFHSSAGKEGTMPTWLVPTLKWGGVALAIISAIAIIYVQFMGTAPTGETGPAPTEAPVTLYWVLLVIGIVAAIAGFVVGRRQRPT